MKGEANKAYAQNFDKCLMEGAPMEEDAKVLMVVDGLTLNMHLGHIHRFSWERNKNNHHESGRQENEGGYKDSGSFKSFDESVEVQAINKEVFIVSPETMFNQIKNHDWMPRPRRII